MSYLEIFGENKERRHNSKVSKDILDGMTKLRMKRSSSVRRWIWELIQNAKDVAIPEKGVSIIIKYDLSEDGPNYLEFIHDGNFFSLDNITYLIEQISSNTESFQMKSPEKAQENLALVS